MAASQTSVDLPRIIENAIGDASHLFTEKEVAFIAEYPAHLPPVQGEPAQLRRVIVCLIASVADKVDRGEIVVHVELLATGVSPAGLEVVSGDPETLSNGGPWGLVQVTFGRSMEAILQIKSELEGNSDSSAEGATHDVHECAAVIDELGGLVWLEAPEGGIARLCFALPLQGVSSDIELSPISSPVRDLLENRLSKVNQAVKTILLLVLDDEIRSLIARDLEAAGHRVVEAESGEQVLSLVRKETPDVVLLDLLARGPTAFEVAMLLKQDRKTQGTPVMFLTSVDDPTGEVSMGAVNFVVRPSDTGALVTAVNALLDSGLSPSARVLVVEPDDAQRETTVLLIQSHGYRVMEARGAEEALVMAERFQPSLVLINAPIAEERDYWLLRSLRQFSRTMDIHVVADFISEAEAKAAIRRGASSYSETGRLPDLLQKVKDQVKK